MSLGPRARLSAGLDEAHGVGGSSPFAHHASLDPGASDSCEPSRTDAAPDTPFASSSPPGPISPRAAGHSVGHSHSQEGSRHSYRPSASLKRSSSSRLEHFLPVGGGATERERGAAGDVNSSSSSRSLLSPALGGTSRMGSIDASTQLQLLQASADLFGAGVLFSLELADEAELFDGQPASSTYHVRSGRSGGR